VSIDNAFNKARRALLEHEAELAHDFPAAAAPLLDLVDDASALLMAVLLSTPSGDASVDLDEEDKVVGGDVQALHLLAQVGIGVRGLRVVRAGRATLACGWEPEARAHDRILIELAAHRKAILDDPSGTEALAWLNRRRGRGISSRVKALAPADLYSNLSTVSHGDPAPVSRLLDPETGVVQLEPRRTNATHASLWLYAGFARDQAVVTAETAGMTLRGVGRLDDAIQRAQAGVARDEDADRSE